MAFVAEYFTPITDNMLQAPANDALLTTPGNLLFHGDLSRRFKAFDVESSALLWETILPGNISVSTIAYAVDGAQYIAVITGDNLKVPELLSLTPERGPASKHTGIFVFSLPQ